MAAFGVLLHWVWYRDPAVLANRLRGLTFGTLDPDSSDRGSNERGVLLWIVVSILRRGGLFPARFLHASCGSYVGLRAYAVRYMGPRGVTVGTLESESNGRCSNPRDVSLVISLFAYPGMHTPGRGRGGDLQRVRLTLQPLGHLCCSTPRLKNTAVLNSKS